MSVKRISGPDAEAYKRLMREAERLSVRVGWTEAARYEDGTPVAVAAANNEFGDPGRGIPPRPFMRPTVSEKSASWANLGTRLFRSAARGERTAKDVYDLLGAKVAGDVAKAIKRVSAPPLSRTTLMLRKMKKLGIVGKVTRATVGEAAAWAAGDEADISGVSKKPLVDTGVMLNSLTHEVVGGGGRQ